MDCPICENQKLEKIAFLNQEIDECPNCLGLWFDQDELRKTKDIKDHGINWIDIDLWDNHEKFKVNKGLKSCVKCSVPLHQINYGNSKIIVDVCNLCQGTWLDRGEFKQIIDYLRRKGHYEIINNYYTNLVQEAIEIFVGPENFKSELADFLTILKVLNYKLNTRHPVISKMISALPF